MSRRIVHLLVGGALALVLAPLSLSLAGARIRASLAAETSPSSVRIEPLGPVNDRGQTDMYVMRGGPHGDVPMVFLHGMCADPLGYAQAFQFSAARRGVLIAPRGDVRCGNGPFNSWSGDLAALDRRLTDTFHELGFIDLAGAVVIGYSQGATRAESLVRAFPGKYTRLVVMSGPGVASPQGLTRLRAAVTMAGDRERQDLMKASAKAFRDAGIPTTFFVIPSADHGSMGSTPEATMTGALDWLFEHERGE